MKRVSLSIIIFLALSGSIYPKNFTKSYYKAITGKWLGKTTYGWFGIPIYFHFIAYGDKKYRMKVVTLGVTKHEFGGSFTIGKADSGVYKGKYYLLLKVDWTKNKNRDIWVFIINNLNPSYGVLRLTNGPKLEYNPIIMKR